MALECQALKVVTEEHIRRGRNRFLGVDVNDLRKAVEKNRIAVRAAIEPPTVPTPKGVPGCLKHVDFGALSTILLLAEKPASDIKVIDELSYSGGRSIGAAQVADAQRKATSAADSNAMQAAEGADAGKERLRVSARPHQVLFASVISQANVLAQKLPAAVAAERLASTGLGPYRRGPHYRSSRRIGFVRTRTRRDHEYAGIGRPRGGPASVGCDQHRSVRSGGVGERHQVG